MDDPFRPLYSNAGVTFLDAPKTHPPRTHENKKAVTR